MDNQNNPLFDENKGQELMRQNDAAAVARAIQEIQASLVIGQRFPRNEIQAKARIMQACQRKGLAEVAEYEYSRGGTRITGPTIDLLRAIASRWGNLLYGWDEVDRRDGYSRVRCWAWDTQSNSRAERTMQVRHWRDTQAGGYEISEERDIYEHIANQAARRVRACLEEVIDSDIIADAVDACRDTLKKGEKIPLKDRAVVMVNAYAEFGVTQAMLEARIGNKLEAISENQLASLRRIFKSLKDGVGKREDYFKPETAVPKFETGQSAGTTPPTATAPINAPSAGGVPTDVADLADAEGKAQQAAGPIVVPPASPPIEPESNLKLIRHSCRASRPVIKEGVLLGFLSEIGLTDGSIGSLEELQMTNPSVLEKVVKDWASISKRIIAALKGQPE